MNIENTSIIHSADVCVIGGGMSGICAAVSAARHGAKVVLMQDRPVLGGNASSEIRMWIRGAAGKENRETGILQEAELENIYRNPTMNWQVWDSVLYGLVKNEKNITLLLNCSCLSCEKEGTCISAVTGWQLNTYTFHTVNAQIFIDASGDSILAGLSGAPFVMGREGADEYDEYAAPENADEKTMGSSILIQARQTDHACPFTPPEWAYQYDSDEAMNLHAHDVGLDGTNFWWIEVSGEYDTLHDGQLINEELLKITYGIWDHLKNQADHGLENWELEWIGFLPGKRESRRYRGAYILNQKNLEEGTLFGDAVAFGGWTMDNHSPLGFYYKGYSSRHIQVKYPYQIPLRSLYSLDVPNLMFAGRNISATHMALSSTRVMATCAVMGQAAGTCAALSCALNCLPDETDHKHIRLLQEQLLDDGCFIPGLPRRQKTAVTTNLSPEQNEVLFNGYERPHDGAPNTAAMAKGSCFTASFSKAETAEKKLRISLDTDFSRESITAISAYQKFALRSHVVKDVPPLHMPAPLLKSCTLRFYAGNTMLSEELISDNHKALLVRNIPCGADRAELSELCPWSGEDVCFFSCDVI